MQIICFINILLTIIIICDKSFSENFEKIIFSINKNIYTTIDIENRKKYLNLLTKENINYTENKYLEDFISVTIFDYYAKKNNINVENNIIEKFLSSIMDNYKEIDKSKYERIINNKKIIRKNIKYDYQRKIILEKFISNLKDDYNFESKNELLKLYDITLEYFIISENNIETINKAKKNYEYNSPKEFREILENFDLEYEYFIKKVSDFDKINSNIKKNILSNNNKIYFIENDYIFIGFIQKELRENIGLQYTLYQFFDESKSLDNMNKLNCNNIDELEKNNRYKIKKFDKIEVNKLNDLLKNNLVFINDKIEIIKDENISYVILCDINYNNDLINQLMIQEKINKKVKILEKDFLMQKKIDYNFKLYE